MSSNIGAEEDCITAALLPPIPSHSVAPVWDPLDYQYTWENDVTSVDASEYAKIGEATASLMREYGLPTTPPVRERIFGEEVGDDRQDACSNPTLLACTLIVQEQVVGMVTSPEDTFISREFWNFCEVTSFLPSDIMQSYDYARRVGDFSNLGYADSVVLRIILDVSKGDQSHSSTPVGKMTMFGNRVSTPRAEFRLSWMIAGWMQDAMLRTSHSSDPKYLPSIMGGCGVAALFDNPLNMYLYVLGFRGGKYSRVYGTASTELVDAVRHLEEGRAATPILCQWLRDRQEYLHGTYDEKVFVPSRSFKGEVGNELPLPLYEATGGQNRFVASENRLIRSRMVIPRREAERDLMQTQRIRDALLGPWDTIKSADDHARILRARVRDGFGGALNANSAFRHLLERNANHDDVISLMQDRRFYTICSGQRDFTLLHAQWLCAGGKGETLSMEDLTVSEDIFVRQEVSVEESLKVGGLPLLPIIGEKFKPMVTKTKVGLYEISNSQEEWAEKLLDKLIRERDRFGEPIHSSGLLEIFKEDPEWVNDDSLLIAECLKDTEFAAYRSCSVILVSADNRLGNQMANTCNILVYRIRPADYIAMRYAKGLGSGDRLSLNQILPYLLLSRDRKERPSKVYVDTGSLASFEVRHDIADDGLLMGRLVRRVPLESGSVDGKRFSRYELHSTTEPVRVRPFRHDPTQLPRRFRYHRPGEDNYPMSKASSAGSWRSTTGSSGVLSQEN